MKRTVPTSIGGAVLLGAALCVPASAQQAYRDDLKHDLEELRETLKAVQKDLQDIKGLIRKPAGPPSAVNQVLDLADDPSRGERTATLTLVEFSDYECPFCAKYARETYPRIEAEYVRTGKLRSVFLDMPLEPIHKHAFQAAAAASCAGEQGKYWEMHDRLFANQAALGSWDVHAEALGLDAAAFGRCMTSGKFAPEIRRDMAEAQKLGVTGTPAFLLARTEPGSSRVRVVGVLRGALPFADFRAEIDRLLAEPRPVADANR